MKTLCDDGSVDVVTTAQATSDEVVETTHSNSVSSW